MAESETVPRLSAGYWRLWWAAGVNNVGDGAFAAAIPLLAVATTRDPRLVSVVAAATYLPWLLLSLPAGALVDRYDRARLMWCAQSIQAVIAGGIAVLAAVGRIGIAPLAVAAFGLGACDVVVNNAAQAILPDIVAKQLLHKANGAQQTIIMIGRQFLGPPIGSLLFAIAMALPFGMDAGSFVLSAAVLATLQRPQRGQVQHAPMHQAVADGLRWLTRHRLLRSLAVVLGVNNFCFQFGSVTLVLLATQTLHLSPRVYGLLLAAAAIGSVVGGLLNARLVARIGALRVLLVALAANVVVFIAIGFSPNAIVLGVLLTMNGLLTTLWNIVTVSVRQEIVPSELLGRVNSSYRMLGWGLMPLGALSGGFVAHLFGFRVAYPIAGVLRGIVLLAAAPTLIRASRADAQCPEQGPVLQLWLTATPPKKM